MSFGTRIFDKLSGNAGIISLVNTRVYSNHLPDNTDISSDAIVFTYKMDEGVNALDGDNVLEFYTLFVIGVSTNTDTLESIQDAIRDCLDDYSDTYLRDILFEGDIPSLDPEKNRYLKTLQYKIIFDNN